MRALTDKIGMFLSGLCAVQCALLPILLSLSAVVPEWAHIGHGWGWMTMIGLIALWSFHRGWKSHRKSHIIAIALVGYSILLSATFLEGQLTIMQESISFSIGGVLMVLAHWFNYKSSNCNKQQAT